MGKDVTKGIIKFRADPVLRRAIKLRAAWQDVDLQDVIVEILRKELSAEIEEVERRGLDGNTPDEPKKQIRKRKEGEAGE